MSVISRFGSIVCVAKKESARSTKAVTVDVPSTVTHYESPVAEWERLVEVRQVPGVDEGTLDAPRRAVHAGETIHDRWFGGPVTTQVSPLV